MTGWQWHQPDHMQIICTSLKTDNHTSTLPLYVTGWMLFLTPNQQCQSIQGIAAIQQIVFIIIVSTVVLDCC